MNPTSNNLANHNKLVSQWLTLLTGLLAGVSLAVSGQQKPLPPGESVQYITAELMTHQYSLLTLSDGSTWRTNITQFGLTGNKILIYGTNLKTGSSSLQLNGFNFTARYQSGEILAQNGYKATLLSVHNDGKRLVLNNDFQAFVTDADRQHSRNWTGNSQIIISEDFRTLLYFPSLQPIAIHLTKTPSR